MTNKAMPTQGQLKAVLRYEPDTGVFYRLHDSYRKHNAGAPVGYVNSVGYVSVELTIDGVKYKMLAHRLAWLYMTGEVPNCDIDHIDHDPTNNAFGNLRKATTAENIQHQVKAHSRNKTGYLGVHYYKARGNYTAQIIVNGKQKHLGYFKTPEEAHEVYLQAKREMHRLTTL